MNTQPPTTDGVIAVDLDGTLAVYQKHQHGIGHPVPIMRDRVLDWIKEGRKVMIFTARTGQNDLIDAWARLHLGFVLPITNIKQPYFTELWDDRAVHVELNTGRILG